MKDGEIDRAWEWGLHEDILFANRTNFFVLAESMIFLAYFSGNSQSKHKWILGILAILFNLLWLYIATYQIYSTIEPLKRVLRGYIPIYSSGTRNRREKWPWRIKMLKPNRLLGIILPGILLLGWVVILWFPNLLPNFFPGGRDRHTGKVKAGITIAKIPAKEMSILRTVGEERKNMAKKRITPEPGGKT